MLGPDGSLFYDLVILKIAPFIEKISRTKEIIVTFKYKIIRYETSADRYPADRWPYGYRLCQLHKP